MSRAGVLFGVVAALSLTGRVAADARLARGWLALETGKAYWLEADPPGQLHGDFNPSPTRTLEMMVVEMK